MNEINKYSQFINNNNKSFILFCIAIICILIFYVVCKNIPMWIKVICRGAIIFILVFVIYNNLTNINQLFNKTTNSNIKENLLYNYLFIAIIFVFIIFLIFNLVN